MRFRFCGDQEVPDWILAEGAILSKMSSVRVTLICRQVLNQITGIGMNYDKIHKLTHSARINFDAQDTKAMIAALHYIFVNSAKNDVDDGTLLLELQQLGLPTDICSAILKCFVANKQVLRDTLKSKVLTLPRVTSTDWRVDYIVSSSHIQSVNSPSIRLSLHLSHPLPSSSPSNPQSTLQFDMNAPQFKLLYQDMKTAREMLSRI